MAECQDFAQFGLAPNLLSAITRMGYTQPTAIQCTAIPVVLQGRDVMGAAQTGTGKQPVLVCPSCKNFCH